MSVSPIEQLSAFNNDSAKARTHRDRRASSSSSNGFLSITVNDKPVDSLAQPMLIQGHALDALDLLPENSIQTVVTSPPYWSLRDYDVDRQIGCDESLADYLAGIVKTFDKVRRVLTADGTIWLNIGDAYTSGNRRYRAPDKKNRARAMSMRPLTPDGLKPKGSDRTSLETGVRTPGRRVVAPVRNHLEQTECPPRIRSGSSDEGARNIVSPVEKPGLLLRCQCSSRTKWPPSSDDLGNPDGTP